MVGKEKQLKLKAEQELKQRELEAKARIEAERVRKLEEEKFITFTKGGGAEFMKEPDITSSSQNPINAVLVELGQNVFKVDYYIAPQTQVQIAKPSPQQPAVQSISSEEVPKFLPIARYDEKEGKWMPLPPARKAPATATATQAELMYKAAVEPAIGTVGITRRNTTTRMISIVASDEDKVLVGSLGQVARNLIGPDIHLSSYVDNADKGVWMPELKKILRIELKNFVENDLIKRAPLMEIRIKEGKDTREIVEQMIEGILAELGYQEKIKDIKNRIRLVQVQIESGKHTNPAIEFFADIGMLECDRYINGDYGDENRVPPQDLQNHFLALLKLSIKNSADFEGKNINEILNMIFAGHLLEIKPADFKSFDEWNRANRQLLQSV